MLRQVLRHYFSTVQSEPHRPAVFPGSAFLSFLFPSLRTVCTLHSRHHRARLEPAQFEVAMSPSTTTQYEALAEQIESILQNPDGAAVGVKDERTRHRLIEGGRKLAASLEQPRETLRRIGYSVWRPPHPFSDYVTNCGHH